MNAPVLELVSPAVREVLQAASYDALVPSVTHRASSSARQILEGLTDGSVLAVPVKSRDDADAALAGLWLWADELDRSHTISQNLHTPSGSFWHAVMHRREGDFWNSKYWYAKCRKHPAIADVTARAGERWEPDAFVDLVERVHRRPDDPEHARAVRLHRIEWEALFEHCVRAATGQ